MSLLPRRPPVTASVRHIRSAHMACTRTPHPLPLRIAHARPLHRQRHPRPCPHLHRQTHPAGHPPRHQRPCPRRTHVRMAATAAIGLPREASATSRAAAATLVAACKGTGRALQLRIRVLRLRKRPRLHQRLRRLPHRLQAPHWHRQRAPLRTPAWTAPTAVTKLKAACATSRETAASRVAAIKGIGRAPRARTDARLSLRRQQRCPPRCQPLFPLYHQRPRRRKCLLLRRHQHPRRTRAWTVATAAIKRRAASATSRMVAATSAAACRDTGKARPARMRARL